MEFEARPPYVRFEQRAEEDRNASQEQGHYVAKNVNYALITSPGSKDTVERNAEEWLEQIKEKARDGQFEAKWVEHFNFAYKQWQEENTIPETGCPIKGWSILSPAQQNSILSANVRTVEDLAVLNESGLARIGMGARDLQNKAKAWLEESSGKGVLVSKNAAMQIEIEALKERITVLEEENKALAALAKKKNAA